MPPNGLINEEDEQEKLPDDYSPPFSAPQGVQDTTDDTHPDADTDVDAMEHYDAGISAATGADDPGNRGVLGYTPPPSRDADEDDDDTRSESGK